MNHDELNELRCDAEEIIRVLYDAKDRSQIRLLQISCTRALELIDEEEVEAFPNGALGSGYNQP